MLSPDEDKEEDGIAGISKARPSESSTITTVLRYGHNRMNVNSIIICHMSLSPSLMSLSFGIYHFNHTISPLSH